MHEFYENYATKPELQLCTAPDWLSVGGFSKFENEAGGGFPHVIDAKNNLGTPNATQRK